MGKFTKREAEVMERLRPIRDDIEEWINPESSFFYENDISLRREYMTMRIEMSKLLNN